MQAYQQISMFESSAETKQQQKFLEILYHDANTRGGFVVRAGFKPYATEHWARSGQALCVEHSSADTYISINSFRKKSRLADLTHSVNALYFDLDWHEEASKAEVPKRIQNTLTAISEASDKGVIPYPTMITYTGRGIGLFYVLERSIANTEKTAKQQRFYSYLYKALADQLEDALTGSELPVLELDRKVVGDRSRVCRLPGTFNTKTGSICKLLDVNTIDDAVKYYSLQELASYIDTYNVYPDKPSEKGKVIDFHAYKASPMLARRLQKLNRAQEVFRYNTGSRELLCFYFYNTACQLYAADQAAEMLSAYNRGFSSPIGDHELQNIIRSVSKAKDQAGNTKGYYRISDTTIIDKLEIRQKVKKGEITEEQADYIGFGRSSKALQREAVKEANRKKKEERDAAIIAHIQMHPEATYVDIAALFGVSVGTINNIVKKHGINRYDVQKEIIALTEEADFETAAEVPSESTSESIEDYEEDYEIIKIQKNALVSRCCDKDSCSNSISYMYNMPVDNFNNRGGP